MILNPESSGTYVKGKYKPIDARQRHGLYDEAVERQELLNEKKMQKRMCPSLYLHEKQKPKKTPALAMREDLIKKIREERNNHPSVKNICPVKETDHTYQTSKSPSCKLLERYKLPSSKNSHLPFRHIFRARVIKNLPLYNSDLIEKR